jgi:hypothetical protein
MHHARHNETYRQYDIDPEMHSEPYLKKGGYRGKEDSKYDL